MNPEFPLTADLASLASQCVQCGLCLPHCPTYRKTFHEAESPRGRVALMKGVIEGRIEATPAFFAHIDHCLACRACETVCPSKVKYGRLLTEAKPLLETHRPAPLVRRLLLDLMASPARLAWWGTLLRLWQASGLQSFHRALPFFRATRLGKAEALLPRLSAHEPWQSRYPAPQARGEVALLLGCAARELDSATLRATLHVLNRLGFNVRVPSGQTCCGALHRHAGDRNGDGALLRRNRAAFGADNSDEFAALLVSATGCAAALKEAGTGLPPVRELCEFLAAQPGWEALAFTPLHAAVAVHEPCSQRNGLGGAKPVFDLLARIPGAQVSVLPGNDQCCGGAGAYPLAQPDMADKLRADKIAAMQAAGCNYIVTANIGCALQLQAGVREAGLQAEILHPVTLLARQLGFPAT